MEKVQFILGLIHSPPSGAPSEDLETYYQTQVRPFLTLLYRFPDVPVTVYYTGDFLEWLGQNHSEYLAVLAEMLKRRQVELLGGGYYGPILPMIPPQDRLGQIEELTTALRKLLGKRPRGCWLEKGIWEQSLAGNLCASGMEFTFLEESSFRKAGITGLGLVTPSLTENQGKILTVFPYSTNLAQKAQAGELGELDTVIPSYDTNRCITLIFTRESLSDSDYFSNPEGLEALLKNLQGHSAQLEGTLPSSYLKKQVTPGPLVYFPSGTWDLAAPTLPQGPWEQAFAPHDGQERSYRWGLSRFPDARNLYNKMIFTHLLAYSIRGDKYKKKSALDDLWKAQNRLSFFQWNEGGFTDPQVRRRAFSHLISAEKATRDPSNFQSFLSAQDYNLDGQQEYIFQGRHFNFFISSIGGRLFEWDCLDKSWNYQDCMNLRTGEPEVLQSFSDLFFPPDQESWAAESMTESSGLTKKAYKLLDMNREQKTLELMARTEVVTENGRMPLRVSKAYRFREHGLEVDWVLEPLAGWEGSFLFATDLALAFRNLSPETLNITQTDLGMNIQDGGQSQELRLRWDHPQQIKTQILHTPKVNAPWDNYYQGHRFLVQWPVKLSPGEVWKNTFRVDIVPQ